MTELGSGPIRELMNGLLGFADRYESLAFEAGERGDEGIFTLWLAFQKQTGNLMKCPSAFFPNITGYANNYLPRHLHYLRENGRGGAVGRDETNSYLPALLYVY